MKAKRDNIIIAAVLLLATVAIAAYIWYAVYTSENITLKYKVVPEEKTEYTEITSKDIGGMLSNESIGAVRVFSYYGTDTKTMTKAGFVLGDKLYSVGDIALNTANSTGFSAATTVLNGKTLYKLTGAFVSGERFTKYYDLSSGTPKLIVTVSGTVSEKDFDEDKKTEIISISSAYAIKVYKLEDDRITVTDINAQTHAAAATYNASSNAFVIVRDLNNTGSSKIFAFTDGKLRLYKQEQK